MGLYENVRTNLQEDKDSIRYYTVLKKLENLFTKLEDIDFGDREDTERYGKLDSITKGNEEYDEIMKEIRDFVKDNNVTLDEFNQVASYFKYMFPNIVYPGIEDSLPEESIEEVPQEPVDNLEEEPILEKPIEEPKPFRGAPYDRAKAITYATGNKWAIENWNATHN